MSDTLLAATLDAVSQKIGAQLPAAFDLVPGEVRLGGDLDAHSMPAGGTAVRWPLGEDEGFLVVALTADAAEMLAETAPEASLVDALTARVEPAIVDLASAWGGIPPVLGQASEIPLTQALAEGPGDPVSVALDDAGTHRATIGLRMVVSDALMAPADMPVNDDLGAGNGGQPLEAGSGPQGPGAVPLEAEQGAGGQGGVPLEGAAGIAGPGAVPLAGQQGAAPPQAGGVLGQPGRTGRGRIPGREPMQVPVGQAHPADFESFDQLTALPGQDHPMSLLGDVELGVTAELGRTELTVRDVLGLTPGSIIELDRAAGSPVDVVVNGTLIARGEVVVIDEEFGIRITEILGVSDEANPFPIAQ